LVFVIVEQLPEVARRVPRADAGRPGFSKSYSVNLSRAPAV